ncbi:hypothetical protein ACQ5SK_26655 [Bradyrhizobium japonicum]
MEAAEKHRRLLPVDRAGDLVLDFDRDHPGFVIDRFRPIGGARSEAKPLQRTVGKVALENWRAIRVA